MANIQSIKRDQAYSPFIVRIVSEDTLATIGTTGYLTDQASVIAALNEGPFEWAESDMALVYASDGWGFFQVSTDFESLTPFAFSDSVVGVPVVVGNFAVFQSTSGNLEDLGYLPSDASKTRVVMANGATVSGQLAVFTDTHGTIDDSANAALAGNLTLSGNYIASAVNALTAHAGGGQGSATALTKQINRVTTVGTAGDSVILPAATAGLAITVINAAAANAMDVFPQSGEVINALAADTALSVAANKTVIFFCAVNGTWNSVVTA